MPVTVTAVAATPSTPRYNAFGAKICKLQTYVTTGTVSAGDVILFTDIKIPHGATVVDIKVLADTPDGTNIYQLGYNGNTVVFGSFTASATPQVFVKTTGLPHTVSVSDDAALRYVTVQLTADGAAVSPTASQSLTLQFEWVMDR